MRKVQLATFDGVVYSGYKHIVCDGIDFPNSYDSIPDNSCDDIIAYDFICHAPFNQLNNIMNKIIKKLRKGGNFSFDFLNFKVLDVMNCEDLDFNNRLYRCKACYSIDYIIEFIQKLGLEIITIETKAETCETTITTKRV